MIGAELPTPFFEKVGIKLEGEWNRLRWLTLGVMFSLVYSLYSLKKFGVYHTDEGQISASSCNTQTAPIIRSSA
jgi:hypothetical protein